MSAVAWLSLEAVLLVAALVLCGGWLWWTASRLDRMHHRIDLARLALDTALVRRSGVALELAATGWLDPARSLLLMDTAHAAREAAPEERMRAESDLSETLRAVLADPDEVRLGRSQPGVGDLLDALARDAHQVEVAHSVHDDLVMTGRGLRQARRVRLLRLAGHAPPPEPVVLDDEPPGALPLLPR